MSPSDSKPPRPRTGAQHLARQSVLRKRIQDDRIQPVILIVEDERLDAHFIETPLRRLFDHNATLVVCPSVQAMKNELLRIKPDVVLLDDLLDADQATADKTIPLIRDIHPKVPIIVFSHLLTRKRQAELARHKCHSIHRKEELDSAVLGEAILSALGYAI